MHTQLVEAVYVGNVIQSSNDACYLSRHVGLKAGAPVHVPALTINRCVASRCMRHAALLARSSVCPIESPPTN